MFNINDIKAFTLNKRRFALPKGEKRADHDNIIIINCPTPAGVEQTIKSPMINDMGYYKNIYADARFSFKAKGHMVNKRLVRDRLEYMKGIEKNTGLKPIYNLNVNPGKNLWYDIHTWNRLFFEVMSKYPVNIKAPEYAKFLKENIFSGDIFNGYQNICMVIDATDWDGVGTNGTNNIANLFYYLMRRDVNALKDLGNVTIVFISKEASVQFKANELDEKSHTHFKTVMARFQKGLIKDVLDDDEAVDAAQKQLDATGSKLGADPKVADAIKSVANKVDTKDGTGTVNGEDILDEEKVKNAMKNTVLEPVSIKSSAMSRRDKELREKQKSVRVESLDMSLEDIISTEKEHMDIPTNDVSNKVKTLNTGMTKIRFANAAEAYNKNFYDKDIVSIADIMKDKSIPVYIRKARKEDSSDSLSLKDTWTFELEDSERRRHTLKFDVPKFIDGRFMYLNGNKKEFNNQRFLKPLVKTGPDTVQVCTNYNKIFMTRYGEKVDSLYEKFKELVMSDRKRFTFVKGDCSRVNAEVKTTIEYDTLARTFSDITYKAGNNTTHIYFNQNKFGKYLKDHPELKMPNGTPMYDNYKRTIEEGEYLPIGIRTFKRPNGKFDHYILLVGCDTQLVWDMAQGLKVKGKEGVAESALASVTAATLYYGSNEHVGEVLCAESARETVPVWFDQTKAENWAIRQTVMEYMNSCKDLAKFNKPKFDKESGRSVFCREDYETIRKSVVDAQLEAYVHMVDAPMERTEARGCYRSTDSLPVSDAYSIPITDEAFYSAFECMDSDEMGNFSTQVGGSDVAVYVNESVGKRHLHEQRTSFDGDTATEQFGINMVLANSDKSIALIEATADSDGNDGFVEPGIVNYILREISDAEGKTHEYDSINAELSKYKAGRRFMYTRCTVMKKHVPLVVFLGYCEGLTTVMRKAGLTTSFSDKRPRLSAGDLSTGIIQFADGYLTYNRFPLEHSLLMNGLTGIDTKSYNYADFDEKGVYMDIFEKLFGGRMIANALDNFYEWMIDPQTKQFLIDLNYPSEFVGLLLAGNALLADNNYRDEIDMENWRIRNNELVYAYAYKRIADAYTRYRMTADNKNPQKISIPRNAILNDIMSSQIVEDVSELSPIVEIEKAHTVTDKGPSGTNLEQAYTQARRCFHPSMRGVMAMSTSPDGNVGISRELTLEPNIDNVRGYVKPKDKQDHEDINLFSAAELLTPLGVTRDDPIRTAMASKQSKHLIPVEDASPVLMSNGAEKVLPYHLSTDFSIVAKRDGKVVERDDKTGVIVIEYEHKGRNATDDDFQVINMNTKVVKNGAGGFYLTNKLNCDKLKKGSSFKKNDVLAYNTRFFSDSKQEGTRFNIGTLVKVSCMGSYADFEDGDSVTKKLSRKMGTTVCMPTNCVVGAASNVDFIAKVGDHVEVDEPLIIYDQSSGDPAFNKMLANIGDDLKETITGMGKTPIKSHYSGTIRDIKIYAGADLDEMSPSLKKIVSAYYKDIRDKKNVIAKYRKGDTLNDYAFTEQDKKIDTSDGKIMGVEVGDGVLIRFFIEYQDNLDVGDKLVHFAALKGINGEMIPEGQEPFTIGRPEEEISTTFAPAAVLARMVPSVLQTMYGNKILIELKRQLMETYQKENPGFKPKDELY